MAVIEYTSATVNHAGGRGVLYTWTGMTTGDTGKPVGTIGYSDRSVQISGTFNGVTATLQGSNDSTNFETLTDPQGNDIAKTTADLEAVTELCVLTRPSISGGSTASITVSLFCKKVV